MHCSFWITWKGQPGRSYAKIKEMRDWLHRGGHVCQGASTVTKWALALKLHFLANVASGYLLVSFRILTGTNSNLFRRAYYGQSRTIQQNLPGLLAETLPRPSGYLPGCSVLQPVENLPVFLPETLPGPSGNLPGTFWDPHKTAVPWQASDKPSGNLPENSAESI